MGSGSCGFRIIARSRNERHNSTCSCTAAGMSWEKTATVADLTVRGATALLAIPCENPSKGEAREPDGKDSDLIDLEALIDEGDRRASQARLKFGLELFQCRTTRGKFPAAFLDRVCEATGKSRQEIDYRLHLAEKYMERLSTDLAAVTTDA